VCRQRPCDGLISSKESYRLCKNDYETEEEARAQQGLQSHWWMNEWMNENLVFNNKILQGNGFIACTMNYAQGEIVVNDEERNRVIIEI
jgi:hypothetical protein